MDRSIDLAVQHMYHKLSLFDHFNKGHIFLKALFLANYLVNCFATIPIGSKLPFWDLTTSLPTSGGVGIATLVRCRSADCILHLRPNYLTLPLLPSNPLQGQRCLLIGCQRWVGYPVCNRWAVEAICANCTTPNLEIEYANITAGGFGLGKLGCTVRIGFVVAASS